MKELFLISLALMLMVCLFTCNTYLPSNAYNVKDQGNNFYEYCLDGKRYAFHVFSGYRNRAESMTRIPEDDGMCKK